MDRVQVADRVAPADVLADLLGLPLAGLAVWAGKAAKIDRRIFVHLGTADGRLWFAKIADEDRGHLRSEYDALRHVQAMLAGSPYGNACSQEVHYRDGVIVQAWREGVSLREILLSGRSRFWRRHAIANCCTTATDWLTGFHTIGAIAPGKPRTIAARGATHGDFKPANILIRGETAITVVDWELFEAGGVQIHDLFHFLLYFGMTLAAPDRMKGVRLTLFERSWISDVARTCLWRYLEGCNCTSAALADAFEGYVEAMLERRAALGLSNSAYFLADVRGLTLKSAPYAFAPPEGRHP